MSGTCSFLVVLFGLSAALCAENTCEGSNPVSDTIYGKVRGSVMESSKGRCFEAYRGIPFAQPPINDLRFRAPVKPNRWDGELDATKDAPMCIQQNCLFSNSPVIEGSENCLFINVYRPKLTCEGRACDTLPVMVFIHYGGFFVGSGRSDISGPEYFMDKDVILVTFNYRLGVFGFLSTYDDASPGNWGYKDQVAALQWVHDNIIYFGGDNNKVTLFGQSAGAASTHQHMLSPMSKGLFQAAISQSGTALTLWAKPQRELALEAAQLQASLVGCSTTTSTLSMVECLRGIPAETLVESANLFRFMNSEPLTIFGPAIEKVSDDNPAPFITDDPITVIQNGEFHNVPWIIGVTTDEGILRSSRFTQHEDLLNTITSNFDEVMTDLLLVELSVPQEDVPSTWNKISEFYLPDHTINVNNSKDVQGLTDLYSDRGFLYPTYQTVLSHAWKGHEKLWFYKFDYRGANTYGDLFAATDTPIDFEWGVSHCDDLLYIFTSKYFEMTNNVDKEMGEIMIDFFTNFAISGTPTSENSLFQAWDPLPDITGRPEIVNSDLKYLKISGKFDDATNSPIKLVMAEGFYPSRMAFWKSLQLFENAGVPRFNGELRICVVEFFNYFVSWFTFF